MIDYDLLLSEAKKIGVDLGEYGADRFDTYAERLVRWNEHVNLTAIVEPDDIVIKHFIDSLYAMKFVDFKAGQSIADVGTGAGFPGMPLILLACPRFSGLILDSFSTASSLRPLSE
jgi:16S rRNA (guanine527-N7)-methyltransferase